MPLEYVPIHVLRHYSHALATLLYGLDTEMLRHGVDSFNQGFSYCSSIDGSVSISNRGREYPKLTERA